MRWRRRLLRKGLAEKQLDSELRFHLDQQIADYVAAGMKSDEARRRVRLEFGGLDQVKEECRDVGIPRFVEELIQDARYGLRQLRRNPGFTTIAVITLALGIGANTAVFSLAQAAFFRHLPYPHANRLAFLWQANKRTAETEGAVSYPNYADWRAQSRDFDDMSSIMFGGQFLNGSGTTAILMGPNGPERVPSALVSTNFFSVLGVSPLLGRCFVPSDATPGHTDVAVISYGLWRARYGGQPRIIGARENIGGWEHTIIGVMPRGFAFPTGAEMWKPREIGAFMRMKTRQYPNMAVIGRLKPGVAWSQAQAEMDTIANRLAAEYPAVDRAVGIRIVPLREQLSEKVRKGIFLLWGIVAAVLLIACLNTAAMMIGRTAARQKEIAVRCSLGATRVRMARQLISESLLLALAGASIGVLLAIWSVSFASKLDADIGRLKSGVLDFHVLAYTAGVTVIAGLICGVLPLFTASRIDLSLALKQTSASAAPAAHLTRRALIVAEVSTAVVLLVGSGLLIRSLQRILHVDTGFDPGHVLALDVRWPTPAKSPGEDVVRAAELENLVARLRTVPGVTSVASGSFVLLPTEMYKVPFEIKGRAADASAQKPLLLHGDASPHFFRAMGIPLLSGREFSRMDTANGAPPVAVVNEATVRRYWPTRNPLGEQFRFADPNFKSPWFTIVGVVGDVRVQGLETAPVPMAYGASAVNPYDELVVRAASRPLALAAAVRGEIHLFDKNLLIDHVRTADSMLEGPESQRQFNAWLVGGFALVTLLLAAVGIYGILAYWVSQRTHEIGVRVALGARRGDVLRLVIGQGMLIALIGLGIGIVGALGLTRFLSSLLYGVKPTDPLTFIVVSIVLTGVALLACYIPARRAARVDPLVALRYE